MKPKALLRIAGILMLLHAVGHTIGAITWKKAPNATVQQVVDGMQSNHFDFMGRSISLGLFFDGYGFIMIGVFLLLTMLLWQLAAEPNSKIMAMLSSFLLFMGICELIWFFPFAAAFSLLAGIITLFSYFQTKQLWRRSN